jgi:hypothetical protein
VEQLKNEIGLERSNLRKAEYEKWLLQQQNKELKQKQECLMIQQQFAMDSAQAQITDYQQQLEGAQR